MRRFVGEGGGGVGTLVCRLCLQSRRAAIRSNRVLLREVLQVLERDAKDGVNDLCQKGKISTVHKEQRHQASVSFE
jgi:hypothetical protein